MISWLHISDLHFNGADDMSTAFLRDELPKFLKGKHIDYIFCTGDIREGASRVFPDEAADYLKELCLAAHVDSTRLFIVPGNHDIDRTSPGRDEAIERVMFQRNGYYKAENGNILDEDYRAIHGGQAGFRTFLGKIFDADRLKNYEDPLKPHFSIETPDFNILHVDTTLVQRSNQEATDLIVGSKALYSACKTLNQEKPTILITHFPFTCLLQDEKKVVSEILYRHGVRLWLAGHEHDHNCQPLKYLYSAQAGVLRTEKNARSTVLIGKYDPVTLQGYISAYTWFPEGWGEYPILWHDYAEENKFPFALRLPKDDGLSREAVLIQQANQIYYQRLPETVIESVFPNIGIEGVRHTEGLTQLLGEAWSCKNKHLILLADGGMGKSTLLLDACRKTENALYISLEGLVTIGYGIEQYCAHILFDGDNHRFEDYTRIGYLVPSLILMVDGLNEVDADAERRFINELKHLNMQKGIQIIISSRSDFTPRYSMSGYQIARLLLLNDEQIMPLFTADAWTEIVQTPTLHHLLSNPMMVTMYKAISPVIEANRRVEFLCWHDPVNNATDLLYNYYLAQIAVLSNREGRTGELVIKAARCIFDILPFIAYQLESHYRFNISNRELREIVNSAVAVAPFDQDLIDTLEEYFRVSNAGLTAVESIDILINDLHLLHRVGEITGFPHQIYRDYLSAYWITKETERTDNIDSIWNSRGIPHPVMEHIRHMSGRYWEGIAGKIHDAGKKRNDDFNLVGNLLDCFPYTDNSGLPDYSDLDLSRLQLPNYSCIDGRISLHGATITKASIGKHGDKPYLFSLLRFSEDNAYLAAVKNNQVVIYALQNDEKTVWHSVSGSITRLEFAGAYLFASSMQSISVFKHDEIWSFTGEIKTGDERSIFNQRLRSIVLKNDALYFYYNNRVRQFRLPDGEMIVNRQSQHAWENPVEGYDLTRLKEKQPKTGIRSEGIVSQEEHNGLLATARDDGDLRVTSGKELYHKLNRGITLLKDGAISGDGKWAATLSYESFSGRRKIQYWNLDAKRKEKELFCPQSIAAIHLSESGNWIIGETEKRCWVLNIHTLCETWYNEHFISNQHSKLVTYEDWVFRKNEKNDIYLYNLETGEVKAVKNRSKNSRIATLMPDGSVASVGNNARKALLKNSRNGCEMQINNDQSVVLGVYGLRKQPFVAIATQDNLISIYHTGTGQRLRKLNTSAGNYIVAVHPEESVIACTSGRDIETINFYEKQYSDKKRGWWYENKCDAQIRGSVMDLAFNDANHELVIILSNGDILYCHEKYCKYHSKMEIITNFNIDAYDFTDCVCEPEIREQLKQNGAII